MLQRIVVILIFLVATSTAAWCVKSRFGRTFQRLDIWESPDRLITVALDGSRNSLGLTATSYHRQISSDLEATDWSFNDRLLTGSYGVRNGPCTLSRIHGDLRKFAGRRRVELRTPTWFAFVLATFVLLLYAFTLTRRQFRRRRRRLHGRCVACGYDLKGVTGEKCPECGRARSVVRATNDADEDTSC